ncbi:hypothetical protein E3P77_01146 [Wallemia ichthyophaga]|uniref:5'-deoxynucleotidase n=1 Tax=Wallemia ichthyophaga TaxID=245174 RepID=A0A4V6TPD4_WALIC|nr:hypothetical protein E3P91_01418 [Wallemia ichthyophaga]TIA82402.1 hypothetical protein E3P98_01439 [Wallemia ichthyophaga]TIA91879.1 hypothetical protein E3P97_01819 [Wallemia ichthyophaga]TIB00882.1 hypothetical protein E3P95_01534 [Wallemia ichthyophaga]TIB01911.1 hypothetical protein E3P94_01666 [Wallemia ichthyophaga]
MSTWRTIAALPEHLQPVGSETIDRLRFMHLIEYAKTQKRTGWLRSGVNGAESISDHMWRMSIMSLVCADERIDHIKASQMAIVHDIAECIVGDIAPSDNITKPVKNNLERQAMNDIVHKYLHGSYQARYLMAIWEEYEQQSSAESTFVKDLDRLEMCLQAFEYERIQNINLNGFYTSLESIKNDQVRIYAELLIQERKHLFNIT